MCGIAGAFGRRGVAELAESVGHAIRCLEHRGPDGAGRVEWDSQSGTANLFHRGSMRGAWKTKTLAGGAACVLAHQRLSILDLSDAAAQPMASPDGQHFLIHNGEIYNYRRLREELSQLGHRFRTQSDSEVLLAAYDQWGSDVVHRIEGMYALAVLDLRRQLLFLARDPFGIKPLYYTAQGTDFAFASEPPALLPFAWVDRRANPAKVFEHLNHWTTDAGDTTFFAAIKSLPAAHFMELPLNGDAARPPVRYWDIPPDDQNSSSLREAATSLKGLFFEAVESHLQSDVPWCVALSGGQDSSSVTMAARRILGEDAELHTVSYIAGRPELNEEIWIDTVNIAAKAIPHKLQINDHELGDDFEHLVRVQGQPMVTPVVYAQHRVFRHAREHGFKVVLEGQGADELLAGYPFYLQARLASLLRHGNLLRAARFLWSAPPRFATGRRYVLRHALRRAFPSWADEVQPVAKAPWIAESWARKKNVWENAPPFDPISRQGGHLLREMIYDAVTQTKLPSLLRYGDHNAMAASVENRVPFLNTRMAEFLFSLPEQYILGDDGTTKRVFRDAMRGTTPQFVLRRKNKIGFEPPYTDWTQAMSAKLEAVLKDAEQLPCFDPAGLRGVREQMKTEGIRTAGFANRVWRIASLAEWARQFGVSFA